MIAKLKAQIAEHPTTVFTLEWWGIMFVVWQLFNFLMKH